MAARLIGRLDTASTAVLCQAPHAGRHGLSRAAILLLALIELSSTLLKAVGAQQQHKPSRPD